MKSSGVWGGREGGEGVFGRMIGTATLCSGWSGMLLPVLLVTLYKSVCLNMIVLTSPSCGRHSMWCREESLRDHTWMGPFNVRLI